MTKVTKIYKNIKKSIDNINNKCYYISIESLKFLKERRGKRESLVAARGCN